MTPPGQGPNTTTTAPVPMEIEWAPPSPPSFRQQHVAPIPSLIQVVPPGLNLDQGALRAQIGDQSMACLAQSLAVTQATSNPHASAFSGIMEGLKVACRLMTKGFQQACLDMEVVVQKTLEDNMALDQAFTEKATQDLNLWAAALWPVLDSDRVSATEMETATGSWVMLWN